MKKMIELPLIVLVWGVCGTSCALDIPMDGALRPEQLKPRGACYEADVLDTLDLAEHTKLSVHALTSFLNSRKAFAPYGHGYFNVRVPYLTSKIGGGDDGSPNWGKVTEALMMVRVMSGNDQNLDIDAKTLEGSIKSAGDAGDNPNAFLMRSFMALHQRAPHPRIWALLQRTADDDPKGVKYAGEGAYITGSPTIYAMAGSSSPGTPGTSTAQPVGRA
jgi:hypothetical protein